MVYKPYPCKMHNQIYNKQQNTSPLLKSYKIQIINNFTDLNHESRFNKVCRYKCLYHIYVLRCILNRDLNNIKYKSL